MNKLKQSLLSRLERDVESGEKGSRLNRAQSAMLSAALMLSSSMALAADDTGQSFLTAITDFAKSPFMVAICIVAVILGVMFAIGGNIKAAFMPFGLAALVALGPWLVNTIFDVFKSVN